MSEFSEEVSLAHLRNTHDEIVYLQDLVYVLGKENKNLRELLRRCAKVIITVENLYPDGFEFKETDKLLSTIHKEINSE
jgi:sulfur transfer complex TusBCD TusB component (DsrH family)